ncbi:hypothetical protein A2U01_0105335, partial [Trifolium medium]|nr:hypothetical protein [Trifolium medium]
SLGTEESTSSPLRSTHDYAISLTSILDESSCSSSSSSHELLKLPCPSTPLLHFS